jgi:hypothetical protein
MCMQSLNFDWTGQPVRENKARTTVPTLDSQPVRMAQRRHLMHSTHTRRARRGEWRQVAQCWDYA